MDKDQEKFENMEDDPGLLTEFWGYLKENRKFWLIPIIIVLLLLGLLIFFASSPAAPFIYTLF